MGSVLAALSQACSCSSTAAGLAAGITLPEVTEAGRHAPPEVSQGRRWVRGHFPPRTPKLSSGRARLYPTAGRKLRCDHEPHLQGNILRTNSCIYNKQKRASLIPHCCSLLSVAASARGADTDPSLAERSLRELRGGPALPARLWARRGARWEP